MPETKCFESFTEAKLRTSASAIQFAPADFHASKNGVNADVNLAGNGSVAVPRNAVVLRKNNEASASNAPQSPGKTAFQGNGIDGGAIALLSYSYILAPKERESGDGCLPIGPKPGIHDTGISCDDIGDEPSKIVDDFFHEVAYQDVGQLYRPRDQPAADDAPQPLILC